MYHLVAPFEAPIATETQRIEACLSDTLERSGLGPAQIDAVVRTGGPAQIPRFVEMLGQSSSRAKWFSRMFLAA